ncbi:MAG: tetratricopeptide repeat protein, partial [Sandaracinaceae bacterium]
MGAGSQELTDRAKLLISERRYQEAVRACRRALLSKPDQVEMRLLLGEALLALERYDEVRIEMMALARRAPDNAAVHRLLGEAYLRDHRPTQAIEALRRALELDPSDEVAEELLKEASDETAPVSTTIERWFAEEAEPTVETGSPHNWEDPTATARPATPPLIGDEPSVQIDPSLTDPHSVEPRTNPQQFTPERRSPPVAPPPRSLGLSAEVAPPLPAPGPHSDGLVLPPGQPSPFALPPLDGTEEPEPLSAIATSTRQQPMPPAHKHIDDFELLASDEVEELEAEPTRALASERPVSPRIRELDEDFDELPTHAIDIKGIEAEATRAHVADPPRPLPPAPAAPPLLYALEPDSDNATRAIGLDEPEPPTRAHMSVAELDRAERVILGASQSEDLPTATAEPPRRVAEEPTPPLPRSSYKDKEDASSHTARVRARSSSRLGLYVGIGVVLLFGLVGGLFAIGRYMSVTELEEIRTAAGEAGDSGRRSEIESVLERLEGTDDRELQALRARLLATLLLEHAQLERREEAEHLVDSLSVSGSYNDAQIARAFLFLAEERPADALQAIRSLEVLDDQIPEAFRARAMALASEGEWVDAAAAAHRAFEVRPSSPRHLALHALMMHRTNNTAGARTLLEGFTGVQSQPALRTTLARILLESGADPERAAEVEARAVIEELPTLATPYDLAWAHLVRAYYEADTGNVAAAEEDARAAAEHTPPGDEAFGMRLAETFLMAGFAEEAETQLHGLPDAAIDRPGRALLSARIALERGNHNVAESSIAEAGDGVRHNHSRARFKEERGDVERARPLYEQA